jgi:hypothetical protein
VLFKNEAELCFAARNISSSASILISIRRAR